MFSSRRTLLRVLASAGLFALLSGCGGDDNNGGSTSSANNNGPVTSTPRQSNGLEFTLSAGKAVYAVGEKVPFTFAVKNVGTQPVAYSFGGCQEYETEVHQNNQLVATLTGCQGCTGNGKQSVFAAGETRTFSVEWNQTPGSGCSLEQPPVAAGNYDVQTHLAVLNLNSQSGANVADAQTGLLRITIQ